MSEGDEIRKAVEVFLPAPPDVEDCDDAFVCQSGRFYDWLEAVAGSLKHVVPEYRKTLKAQADAAAWMTPEERAEVAFNLAAQRESNTGPFGVSFHFDPGKVNMDPEDVFENVAFRDFLLTCKELDVDINFLGSDPHDDMCDIDIRGPGHLSGDIYLIINAVRGFGENWQEVLDELVAEYGPGDRRKMTSFHNDGVAHISKRRGSDSQRARGHLRAVSRPPKPDGSGPGPKSGPA